MRFCKKNKNKKLQNSHRNLIALKAARSHCIGCQVGVTKTLMLTACLNPNLNELKIWGLIWFFNAIYIKSGRNLWIMKERKSK